MGRVATISQALKQTVKSAKEVLDRHHQGLEHRDLGLNVWVHRICNGHDRCTRLRWVRVRHGLASQNRVGCPVYELVSRLSNCAKKPNVGWIRSWDRGAVALLIAQWLRSLARWGTSPNSWHSQLGKGSQVGNEDHHLAPRERSVGHAPYTKRAQLASCLDYLYTSGLVRRIGVLHRCLEEAILLG